MEVGGGVVRGEEGEGGFGVGDVVVGIRKKGEEHGRGLDEGRRMAGKCYEAY